MIWNDFVIRSRRLDVLLVSRNYTVVCTFYRTKMNVNLCTGPMIVVYSMKILLQSFHVFTWCSKKVEKFGNFYLTKFSEKLFQVIRLSLEQFFLFKIYSAVEISSSFNQKVL